MLAAGAALVAVAACGGEEADPTARWQDDLPALRLRGDVVLPVELPPDLREISAVTGNGLPLVSFYSTNEPVVTVCTGSVRACRSAIRASRTLQTVALGGATALLTVDPAEGPERARLSRELADFWSTVPVTRAAPGWLTRTTS